MQSTSSTYTHYEALTPVGCLYTDTLAKALAYVQQAGKGNLTEIVEQRRRIPVSLRSTKTAKRTRARRTAQ